MLPRVFSRCGVVCLCLLSLLGVGTFVGCQKPATEHDASRFQIVGGTPPCCQTEQATAEAAPPAGGEGEQKEAATSEVVEPADVSSTSASSEVTAEEGGDRMAIRITSPAFHAGQPIPRKYTGEGEDVSPPLEWSGVPEGTQELVLICDDPDAPTPEPWVHWVLYKIPADVTKLPENLPKTPKLENPPGALQGKNSWPSGQTIGYRGPMPPPGHGRHRYYFRLYALNTKLNLQPGATKKEVMQAIKGHILGEGELIGTYERR